jgi:ATP-dependent Zn protease
VSFAPGQPRAGMPAPLRTVLFWLLMIALAFVLWKMASKDQPSGTNESTSAISYSDFMTQVDKNNVNSVKILEAPATAEVEGQLREPPQNFRTSIPKEMIPALTEQLRKQGVTIEVAEQKKVDGLTTAINFVPFFVILAIWIYMVKRRWSGSQPNRPSTPATSTPTTPTNRPLG